MEEMERMRITETERYHIRKLEKLASTFPKTLWLFSASGSLQVHKLKPDGNRYMNPDGSVSQEGFVTVMVECANCGADVSKLVKA